MTHESRLTRNKVEYPIDWMKLRQVPCSKVTTNCRYCKSNDSCLSPLNMEIVCISFSQLGIQRTYKLIHFHESYHSFESFKRMHCPLSYCVSICLVILPSLLSFCLMFKGRKNFTSVVKTTFVSVLWVIPMVTLYTTFHNFVLCFMLLMWDLSWPSFN